MSTNIEWLERATGMQWRSVDRNYIEYRLSSAPFGEFCAVSSEDNDNYFLPDVLDDSDVYNAANFATKFLSTEKLQVFGMPAVEINLDHLPEICFSTVKGNVIITGTLKLTGTITIHTPDNSDDVTISPDSLNVAVSEAKRVAGYVVSSTKISIKNKKLVLTASLVGELGEAEIEMDSPNSFTASFYPTDAKSLYTMQGFGLETSIGYQAKGTITVNPNSPTPAGQTADSYSSYALSDQEIEILTMSSIMSAGIIVVFLAL